MNDLVKRLRLPQNLDVELSTKAADEIERLMEDRRTWYDRYVSLFTSIQTGRVTDDAWEIFDRWAGEVDAYYKKDDK